MTNNSSQLIKSTLALAIIGFSSNVVAHGYVSEVEEGVAASRGALCSFPAPDTGEKNTNCGDAQYEPHSLEGEEGFPELGPKDGEIAGAGLERFSNLNEQTADRWVKRPITAGIQNFEWTFTVNHVTRDWKYYITQPNWNPNGVLARSSFDLTPFCVIDGGMVQPPMRVVHQCDVPEREGYHVILAVWDVGDTDKAFYNVIDVNFDDDTPTLPGWENVGTIYATQDLNVGDTVYTRVFDNAGENVGYRTELTIDESNTDAKKWSHNLATKINAEQSDIKAGQYNEGEFTPAYGTNPIYSSSDINSVEIGYDLVTPPMPDPVLYIDGLESHYEIGGGAVSLDLNLTAEGDLKSELTVYNHGREALANWSGLLADGTSHPITLELSKSEPGHHMLVQVIKDADNNVISQETLDFHLNEEDTTPPPSEEYDFVFPDGLSSYTEGTKVLASDNGVYQCKSFPNSGFCQQWNEGSNAFEPGVGSHWQQAWDRIN
ncbi:N-acetylglucosamine-binding protein GbpA [Vibrio sp. SCSIO 43135]|uniref:N-acetylglucosamine-binding protein GbpA n=1 Tax=Vibrio sp. SCSIO 43135 TaxID=2819096 RepID=UPI002075ACEC|nr:N-acetylglucosamine-binding protein GbpA [Vibrio sp. SCSIO 43135]USD40086.1 N-acetylglucosamine-binding protein GbpA [Vibrio sp. SCSIO 43135]